MDEENKIGFSKYIFWLISALAALFVWFVLLVFVDDTGLWHFEYASLMADFMRFGIIIVAAAIGAAVGYIINVLLIKFFSRSSDSVGD